MRQTGEIPANQDFRLLYPYLPNTSWGAAARALMAETGEPMRWGGWGAKGAGPASCGATGRQPRVRALRCKRVHRLPPTPPPAGMHHTKALLLRYPTGLRLIVHSGSISERRWRRLAWRLGSGQLLAWAARRLQPLCGSDAPSPSPASSLPPSCLQRPRSATP